MLTGGLRVLSRVKETAFANPRFEKSNTTGTASAHVGETATPKDSTTPSNESSIGAHVSEVEEHDALLTRSIQKVLATHAIDDPI